MSRGLGESSMQRRGRRWRYGLVAIGLLGGLAALAAAAVPRVTGWVGRSEHPDWSHLPTAAVRRADLWVNVTAAGLVASLEQTEIECELESLDAGVNGQKMRTSGASTILSVVEEGVQVKKGDVLCELDSSSYEELVRQQEMTVQRAQADHLQAKLTLDVARVAVQEFRDGSKLQIEKTLAGQIAMAEANLERAVDHLRWSRRMFAKGYASVGQVSTEEVEQQRAIFALNQAKVSADMFHRYEVPGVLRQLGNNVLAAEATMEYQDNRLRRHLDRLELFKKQVERCTIRAPHDGFLIHANDPYRNIVIEPGLEVRQRQKLFSLPDLSKMEVSALLHESIVEQVKMGMRTKVRVEGLPHHELEGHVTSVAQLPTRNYFSEVTYYTGIIKIDSIPRGLKPGMSAEVDIATGHKTDVLTIPTEALTVEDGHDVCYVAEGESLERREVKVGQSTRERLEVTEGLTEGEQVVLDPTAFDARTWADSTVALPAESPAEAPETPAASPAE